MSETTDTAIAEKVERFEKLVQMDPEDATSHFTLGTAYAEAGRHEQAAESFLNAIAINADYSKAFQLAGQSLIKVGDTDRAAKVLTRGYEAAVRLGDLMPKKAIVAMLEQIGQPVPEVEDQQAPADAAPTPDGSFIDQKTGQPGTRLPRPPFRGPIGQWIHDHISNETWQVWLGQGTKIINELRLDLSSQQGSDIYDFGMILYVGLDAEKYRELTSTDPPEIPEDYKQMLARILNASPDQLASFGGNIEQIVREE